MRRATIVRRRRRQTGAVCPTGRPRCTARWDGEWRGKRHYHIILLYFTTAERLRTRVNNNNNNNVTYYLLYRYVASYEIIILNHFYTSIMIWYYIYLYTFTYDWLRGETGFVPQWPRREPSSQSTVGNVFRIFFIFASLFSLPTYSPMFAHGQLIFLCIRSRLRLIYIQRRRRWRRSWS